MKIYNKEKTAIIENPDLTRGYLVDDEIVKIIPAKSSIQEQFHYITIKTYENGGADLKKVIDVPYQPATPQIEKTENIQVYIPYTETELYEIKKQELRAWRKKNIKVIDCAVWYDCLTQEEKEQVKQFRLALLDITKTFVKPSIPTCVDARINL